VGDHFGESPHFALLTVRLSERRVEKQEVIENPYKDVETAKGIRVAEWLVQNKVDQVFMREDLSRKGPGYVLGNAGVTTVRTSARDLKEVVESMATDPL
jgi:predicted Fe-Mo cluster-binding NifX family protein